MLKGHFLLNFVCLTALSSFIGNFHFDFNLIYFVCFIFCGFGLLHLSLLAFDLCVRQSQSEFVY